MRKQASGRAIKKHMQNGGMNSFTFHPSPRMMPHIYKPEVQYVELSIEQFVSHGKKVKDNCASEMPVFKEKLTVAEIDLIAKYFHHRSDNPWRPSLIAFPHFQAFPSRVHKVMHSHRTGMLIDTMQHLQGLNFSRDSRNSFLEDEVSSPKSSGVQPVDQCENHKKDSLILDNGEGSKSLEKVTQPELSPVRTIRTQEKHSIPHFCGKNPAAHSYLFGSESVSIDALGKVLILSLPSLPFQELSDSKNVRAINTLLLNHSRQKSFHLNTYDKNYDELAMQAKTVAEQPTSHTTCINNGVLQMSLCNFGAQLEKTLDGPEKTLETSTLKRNQLNEGCMTTEMFDEVKIEEPSQLDDDHDLRDTELSPRLTNLIKSGVVPESPINEGNNKTRNEFLIPDFASPVKLCAEQLPKFLSLGKNKKGSMDNSVNGRSVSVSPVNREFQTPLVKMNCNVSKRACTSASPVVEETKLADITNGSCSRDWGLSSEEKSQNVKPVPKLKRLRKVADCGNNRNLQNMIENTVILGLSLARSSTGTSPMQDKHDKCKRRPVDNVRAFIEDEAEVSAEAELSDDEEDNEDNSFDDSFIDDRINPTTSSTRAESSEVDMMAIYRRSLLSQSPLVRQLYPSATYSPDRSSPIIKIIDCSSSSGKTLYSLQTPQTGSGDQSACNNSESFQINQEKITSGAIACETSDLMRENVRIMENRKRKLSFYQSRSIPAVNLEREFSLQSEAIGKESCHQGQAENIDANEDALDDDQFYEHLDLDAMEEHASLILKQKLEFSEQKQEIIPKPELQNLGVRGSPSFDLGI